MHGPIRVAHGSFHRDRNPVHIGDVEIARGRIVERRGGEGDSTIGCRDVGARGFAEVSEDGHFPNTIRRVECVSRRSGHRPAVADENSPAAVGIQAEGVSRRYGAVDGQVGREVCEGVAGNGGIAGIAGELGAVSVGLRRGSFRNGSHECDENFVFGDIGIVGDDEGGVGDSSIGWTGIERGGDLWGRRVGVVAGLLAMENDGADGSADLDGIVVGDCRVSADHGKLDRQADGGIRGNRHIGVDRPGSENAGNGIDVLSGFRAGREGGEHEENW